MKEKSAVEVLESCKSMKQAFQIHAQLILNGFHNHIFSLSRLISFCALSASPEALNHSRLLFSHTRQPNLFIWNTMIRGYSRSTSPHESLLLFNSMNANSVISPNNFTFPFVLNACAKLPEVYSGKQIHSHVIRKGFESDIFIRNSLIHFYLVFGFVDNARVLFDESSERDLVSFNTMINGLARHGRATDSFRLFAEMWGLGVNPDEFTVVALLSACSILNDSKSGKQVHNLVYRILSCDDSNALLKSAIVDMYAKCGSMEMAERVFRSMGIYKTTAAWSSMVSGYARCGEIGIARRFFDQVTERDLVSWTAMISGYSQTGRYTEALELFVEMEGVGIKPDEITLVAALSACSGLGALSFGRRLHHQYIRDRWLNQNLILSTAIVDMYAKCGSIETALHLFHGIVEKSKSVFFFNAMIYGLAQHGRGETAVKVFREMESARLKPDKITFVGVLCACSHGGLVEEGKKIFDSMSKVHGLKPESEHYCCVVDLLGRSGYLKEAHEFIQQMPFDVNPVVWRSLLGSCRIYGDVQMAHVAAKRLLELEPNHGGHYVLLSNMLTDTTRWEDAGNVRTLMEDKGIAKPPGWSYIELNGTLHQFRASHKSHPQAKKIELMLEDMARKLKLSGYVPDTTRVLFDIDEEEKESIISNHSEKLALAFGLINLDHEATILIVKNLRVCGDCHSAFKLFSKIYGRYIVLRDAIRFHHFSKGVCSCKDFW